MIPKPENNPDHIEITDPKLQKQFKQWLKKRQLQPSKKELDEIGELSRQALSLWKKRVRERDGKACQFPGCKKKKYLNAHHIESYSVNKMLRYDLNNGILLCPSHHKFNRLAAHKSFCFVYELMAQRPDSLNYLLENYMNKVEINKEFLLEAIKRLEWR